MTEAKKRLTLKERLELAAKSKSKSKPASSQDASDDNLEKVESNTSDSIAIDAVVESSLVLDSSSIFEEKENSDIIEGGGDELEELGKENDSQADGSPKLAGMSETQPENKSYQDLEQKFKSLKLSYDTLLKEKTKIPKMVSPKISQGNQYSKTNTDIDYILKEKDQQIEQLLKEGENLSIKELKLNQLIKKLKASESDNEKLIRELSSDNRTLQIKLEEFESLDIKKFESLESSYNTLVNEKKVAEENYRRLLSENYESKYNELLKNHEDLKLENKSLLKQSGDLKIQFELFKKQADLSYTSLEKRFKKSESFQNQLKDEKNAEISRLENKVEQLRLINEDTKISTKSIKNKDNGTEDNLDSDLKEYKKLLNNHDILQSQYQSSQENFKIIEDKLISKIDFLESELNTSQKKENNYQKKIKLLTNDLKNRTNEIESLQTQLTSLKKRNEKLEADVELHFHELIKVNEDHANMKSIYDNNRVLNLNKITSLESEVAKLNDQLNNPMNYTSMNSRFLSNISEDADGNEGQVLPQIVTASWKRNSSVPSTLNGNSPNNGTNSFSNNNSNSNWEIKLGESSTTPLITSRSNSFFQLPSSQNNSIIDLSQHSIDYETNDYATIPGNNFHSNSISQTTNNGPSIHMVGRMGAQIRRLEIELFTTKEENAKLSKDKSDASMEILNLLKEKERVDELTSKIADLQIEVNKRLEREKTMLEVIGEKSEQVAELKADVEDLKDLCKLQVQQMMELQKL